MRVEPRDASGCFPGNGIVFGVVRMNGGPRPNVSCRVAAPDPPVNVSAPGGSREHRDRADTTYVPRVAPELRVDESLLPFPYLYGARCRAATLAPSSPSQEDVPLAVEFRGGSPGLTVRQ
jgi:hypothetical protein